MADDLGYADLSCYGSKKQYTPRIDSLAARGMRLTDYHSNGAMCSPSRAALLTGVYQQRNGIETALDFNTDLGLYPQPTIASCLKEAGYATALIGKWHCGDKDVFHPLEHGFDEFRGLLTGDGDYISRIDRQGCRDWWHDREAVEEEGYTTELITKHSLSFVEENQDQPFFLYIAHLAPHFPYQGPEDQADRVEGVDYRSGNLKFGTRPDKKNAFTEMVEAMDKGVGDILDKLEELKIDDNTLVIFMSDNGGYNEDINGYVAVSDNGPYRGQKTLPYEGGHRVPCIFYWPGKIAEGTVSDATVLGMDILPTLLDLLGEETTGLSVDGISLAPLLLSGEELPERSVFLRCPKGKYVRRGPWKLVETDASPELYHLDSDPSETTDLSESEAARVCAMKKELAEWEQDVDSSHQKLYSKY